MCKKHLCCKFGIFVEKINKRPLQELCFFSDIVVNMGVKNLKFYADFRFERNFQKKCTNKKTLFCGLGDLLKKKNSFPGLCGVCRTYFRSIIKKFF